MISRNDKIKSTLENIKIPSLIFLGLMAGSLLLTFFAEPLWPLIAFMGACTLVYVAMGLHYFLNGPWTSSTPLGIKVWYEKGVRPYDAGYIDSRILIIIKDFCLKSGIKNIDRNELIKYICNIQIYVMAERIHALEKVIGATQPGISTKFKDGYFDLALDHEINLHLCHYFFPHRSEEADVAWMVLKGIE